MCVCVRETSGSVFLVLCFMFEYVCCVCVCVCETSGVWYGGGEPPDYEQEESPWLKFKSIPSLSTYPLGI